MKWLLCAQRPLKTAEFVAAVGVYSHDRSPTLREAEVLSICCNLVVLDSQQNVFRFAHLSVREYLESLEDYTPFMAHTLALERCLDALMFGQTPAESVVRENSIFKPYTNLYWLVHCQSVLRDPLMESLPKKLKEFLFRDCDTSPSFIEWVSQARQLSVHLRSNNPLTGLLRAASSTPPTPLFMACSFGLVSIVNELGIFANVDWNQRNEEGYAGLHLAAMEGHKAVVQLLLERGADIDSKDKGKFGRTPLSWAAENGHQAIVQLLLERGADIDSKDKYGRTPLWWSVEKVHEAVVQLLLDNGAEVDSKGKYGRTPLSWAAEYGHEAVVQLLLDNGAEVDSKDDNSGETPLSWAAAKGHKAVVRLLLDKAAEVDSKGKYGQTPLLWAAANGRKAVVQLLLDNGAEVDSKDDRGRTPLWWAAAMGHQAVVQLLLANGAEVGSKDNRGRTPLRWAAKNGHEAVVQLLESKTE